MFPDIKIGGEGGGHKEGACTLLPALGETMGAESLDTYIGTSHLIEVLHCVRVSL